MAAARTAVTRSQGYGARTLTLWLLALSGPSLVGAGLPEAPVRQPAVAGHFYPAEPERLDTAIRSYLADALAPVDERPLALIAPHAGLVFSGQIGADAWRQAEDGNYELVVLLGTNHVLAGFRRISIYPGAGYRTPLGVAAIDLQVTEELLGADPAITFEPRIHRTEHSVEVQVPFLQVALPEAKMVAAVIGHPDPKICGRFGRALARVISGRRALIVASSDLSHYPDYPTAVSTDLATLEAIARLDGASLHATLARRLRRPPPGLATCACGEAPVLAALAAVRALGGGRSRVLSYANSGDTAVGNHARVVGYGAVAIFPGQGEAATAPLWRPREAAAGAPLTDEDRRALLEFARRSIEQFLASGTVPLARPAAPSLRSRRGAFVTLRKKGKVRGCQGRREADRPLGQVVGAAAVQAAVFDPRFPPLQPKELTDIDLEISVLEPLRRARDPRAITPGLDGVFLRRGSQEALFLPSVAADQGWDRQQLLDHLAAKAGLPPGAWRQGAELYTFRAESFRESDQGRQPAAGSP